MIASPGALLLAGRKYMSKKWKEFRGKEVKDKITGYSGVCTGVTSWLYGCDQYCITPKADGSKLEESKWFDEGRIEVIGEGIKPEKVQVKIKGGENNHPSNSRR